MGQEEKLKFRCPKKTAWRQLVQAEERGGSDYWEELGRFGKGENRHYSEKGGHRSRSIANDVRHRRHFRSRES